MTTPVSPAVTYTQAVELTIFDSNQFHEIVNGDAATTVTTASGNIDTVRKALTDNFYFKSPILWSNGSTNTVFNQIYTYTDGTLWFSPFATSTNPISLTIKGPYNDSNWKMFTGGKAIASAGGRYIQAVAPTQAVVGDSWYNTTDGRTYVKFNDGTSVQWVEESPQSASEEGAFVGLRVQLARLAAEAGYNLVSGSFEEGGTLTSSTNVLWYRADGKYYSWGGSFNKVVPINSTPTSSGGVGAGAWVDRTQETFREELGSSSGSKYIGTISSVSSLRGLTGLSAYVGKRLFLAGYYSADGVGSGDFIITKDTTSADNGGTVIVTTDGVRLKRPRKMRLYSADFGVIGDWNGVTGTDNKTAIENMIAASNSSQPWCINQDNVGVSSVVITGKSNWSGIISGSVFNISAKPATGATDEKGTAGGLLPTFKITGCDKWKLSGGYVDNRYREAFYIENCTKFINECDVLGAGINNNLLPNYYRYCTNFKLKSFRHERTSEKPAIGYYDHCNNLHVWDSSNFKILDFEVIGTGSNGVYIGSNCRDYSISDFVISNNAMSGIQLAWSSFGIFPYRGTITNGLINGNRADGIDVNNTSSTQSRVDLEISNILSAENGYNDDGTVTVDGSGIGTFFRISHFDVKNCSTTNPAGTGIGISRCSYFSFSGIKVKKDRPTNSYGHGCYIEYCDNFSIDADVITDSTNANMFAIRTYGAFSHGKISGSYVGHNSLDTSVNTTYVNVLFDRANIVSPSATIVPFKFKNVNINCATSQAASILADMIDCRVYSQNGHGGVVYYGNVTLDGSYFRGSANGLYVQDSLDKIRLRGTKAEGVSGPGLRISGGTKHIIQGSEFISSTGNSISMKNATAVLYIGNTDTSAPPDLAGTTFTLQN